LVWTGRLTSGIFLRMIKLPHTRSCFVCGLHNPSGLKLDFETDGCTVWTRFTMKPEHAGFRETMHGGIMCTVLDEVMVWACGVRTKRFAYSVELNFRFLQPARPGDALEARGELVQNRRNRLFETRGELRNGSGTVLATGSGKYLPIKEAAMAELMQDFVESPEVLFRI
jgi:acyl-coenzyme A thioesterase PaaI-like protein